jgi:hypothetical protein
MSKPSIDVPALVPMTFKLKGLPFHCLTAIVLKCEYEGGLITGTKLHNAQRENELAIWAQEKRIVCCEIFISTLDCQIPTSTRSADAIAPLPLHSPRKGTRLRSGLPSRSVQPPVIASKNPPVSGDTKSGEALHG